MRAEVPSTISGTPTQQSPQRPAEGQESAAEMGLACHRGTTPGCSLDPVAMAHMGDGAQNRPGVSKHRPRGTKTRFQKMSFLGINGTTGATGHPDEIKSQLCHLLAGQVTSLPSSVKWVPYSPRLSVVTKSK